MTGDGPVRGCTRRGVLVAGLAAGASFSGCAAGGAPPLPADSASGPVPDWTRRLRGDAVVLLGEVHDNARLHSLRLAALRQAVEAGWRPAIAMEQFDRERQADFDRARRERPQDPQHLIDQAAPASSGWDWAFYRPVLALVLQYKLPLRAANVSSTDTRRVVREGYAAVFGADQQTALGLDQPRPSDWQAAQEHEIDIGHCGALPATMWPAMARAQFARDAVMASVLQAHAANGVVLLAGNGHVRRDLGVPRWLNGMQGRPAADRVWAVGYLETSSAASEDAAFDAVVRAAPAPRADPCEAFGKPAVGPSGPKPSPGRPSPGT